MPIYKKYSFLCSGRLGSGLFPVYHRNGKGSQLFLNDKGKRKQYDRAVRKKYKPVLQRKPGQRKNSEDDRKQEERM
ncbi:hypothetical protein AALB16_15190 [Lachnospiraceae bacterium 62-35]